MPRWNTQLGLAFASFCFLISAQAAKIESPPLKTAGVFAVCQYAEFEPISYGSAKGFEADLMRAVAKLWHVKIVFYPEATFTGFWFLPSKRYTVCDVSIGGITPTQGRIEKGAVFSVATIKTSQSLLIREKDYYANRVTGYGSFKAGTMKIGVIGGSTGEEYAKVNARENYVPQNVIVPYPSETALLKALRAKEIDAIARSDVANTYQASMDKSLKVVAQRDFNESYAVAVDRNNRILLGKLNQAIIQLTENSTITLADWSKDPAIFMKNAK